MNRIKKGDKVRIISGKNLNKEGTVLKVFPKLKKAIVEGQNIVKVHKKADANGENGGIKTKEAPIHLSKLALIAPKAARGVSKIAYTKTKENKKIRVSKKDKKEIGGK